MWPVYPDCPFLIAPSVFSNVYIDVVHSSTAPLFEDHRTKNRMCNKMNTTVPHVEQELLTLSEHLSSIFDM